MENRIIKFRGKNIHTGEWLYGDYHREGKTHYITKSGDYLREYAPIEFIVDGKTIGQFTGLPDKNGKEIYEGDIIHLNDEEFELEHGNGVVIFLDKDSSGHPCGGIWYVEDADEDSNTNTSLFDLHWEGGLEIIGNRFDNPSLISDKQ